MNPAQVQHLIQLFEKVGAGWFFHAESERAQRAEAVEAEIQAVEEKFASCFHHPMKKPLLAQMSENPDAMAPLIQAFAASLSVKMKTMIYCLLTGGTVEGVRFEYKREDRVLLYIDIAVQGGGRATFDSDQIWDVEVLRHFGLAKLGDRPFIDGYYAFRRE